MINDYIKIFKPCKRKGATRLKKKRVAITFALSFLEN